MEVSMTCADTHRHPWFFACGPGPFSRRHGHHQPPWVHGLWGGGGRAERGEVRWLLLDAPKDAPRHGYEVIQTIEERSGGRYRPSPGTVYPTLQMLEELGWVTVESAEGNRKVHAITDAGRTELAAHVAEVEEAYGRWDDDMPSFDDLGLPELGARLRTLVHATRRGLRRGRLGPDELKALRGILDESLTRLESYMREHGK
jgi:DNA-binding PadR family transcriptional regulator